MEEFHSIGIRFQDVDIQNIIKYYGITSAKISQLLLLLLYFTSDMLFKNDKAHVVLEFTEVTVPPVG